MYSSPNYLKLINYCIHCGYIGGIYNLLFLLFLSFTTGSYIDGKCELFLCDRAAVEWKKAFFMGNRFPAR